MDTSKVVSPLELGVSKTKNQIEELWLPVTVGGGEQDSVFSIAGGQPGTVGGDLLWAGGWWRVEMVAWLWWAPVLATAGNEHSRIMEKAPVESGY